jgi:guanylate kinase
MCIHRRLAAAAGEVEEARHFDYVVVSGTREEDFSRARAILDAERCRTRRERLDFDGEAAG